MEHYTPCGTRKDVYFSSSRYILIMLYLEKPSMKDILSKSHMLLIIISVIRCRKLSFRQASFRSLKYMQTYTFPFFLMTSTTLATQSGCCFSLMNPKAFNFLTAISIVSYIFRLNFRCYWFTSLVRFDIEIMLCYFWIQS